MVVTPAAFPHSVALAIVHARGLGLDALDAQLLLLHAMGMPSECRVWLTAHADDPIAPSAGTLFLTLLARRLAGEPLAYIVGQKEFYGISLSVDSRVLIPRPDTETLVEWSLEILAGHPGARVLDLGTGSGAIALALKHQRPDLQILALDASAAALELARQNAARLGLEVCFLQSDWLRAVAGVFDLILSNPPYVGDADPHLAELAWEPEQALAAGADGLDDLREIIATAPPHLQPGSWLLVEHGHDQARRVGEMLRDCGFQQITSRRDLGGIERCSAGRRPVQ